MSVAAGLTSAFGAGGVAAVSVPTEATTRPEVGRGRTFATAWALGGALVLGAAIRALFFVGLVRADPLADPKGLVGDALYDHEWAVALAEGRPFDEGRPYWRPPLYPFFVSLVYRAFGPDPRWVWAFQHVLGLGSLLLVHSIARRLFGPRAASAAAFVAALYAPYAFFEGRISSATWVVALSLLSFRLILAERRSGRATFAAGLSAGLAAGFHPASLLPSGALAAALLFERRQEGRRLLRACLFASGIALGVGPIGLSNLVRSDQWVLVSANGGVNLFLGNNPEAAATFRVPSDEWADVFTQRKVALREASVSLGRPANESDASRHFTRKALQWAAAEPGAFVRLVLRKAQALLANFEFDPLYMLGVERGTAPLLWIPFLPFAAILGLVVVGLLLRLPGPARGWFAAAAVGGQAVAALAFFAYSRFRLPAVAILAAFAGSGAVALRDALRSRPRRALGAAIAGVALSVASVCFARSEAEYDRVRGHVILGDAARSLGRIEQARRAYAGALDAMPLHPPAWYGLARIAEREGDERRALDCLERAHAADPSWNPARLALGELLASARDPTLRDPRRARALLFGTLVEAMQFEALWSMGEVSLRRATALPSDHPERGEAFRGALEWFRRATEADPRRPQGWRYLAECLRELGREDEAREAARRAEARTDG